MTGPAGWWVLPDRVHAEVPSTYVPVQAIQPHGSLKLHSKRFLLHSGRVEVGFQRLGRVLSRHPTSRTIEHLPLARDQRTGLRCLQLQ